MLPLSPSNKFIPWCEHQLSFRHVTARRPASEACGLAGGTRPGQGLPLAAGSPGQGSAPRARGAPTRHPRGAGPAQGRGPAEHRDVSDVTRRKWRRRGAVLT